MNDTHYNRMYKIILIAWIAIEQIVAKKKRIINTKNNHYRQDQILNGSSMANENKLIRDKKNITKQQQQKTQCYVCNNIGGMKIDSFNRLHIGLYSKKKNMNASAVRLYVRMCVCVIISL